MGTGPSTEAPDPSPELGKNLLHHINYKGGFDAKDEQLARQTWDCYDVNKSGVLERAEASVFLRDIASVQTTRKVISLEQADAYQQKAMELIDKNGGSLSFEMFFGENKNALLSPTTLQTPADSKAGAAGKLDASYWNNKRGQIFEVFALKDIKKYNGVRGCCMGFDAKAKRVKIEYATTSAYKQMNETILIKPENLRKAKDRVYCLRFTETKGRATSIAAGGLKFQFVNWKAYIGRIKSGCKWTYKNLLSSTTISTKNQPFDSVENPGGTQDRKGTLHTQSSVKTMLTLKNWRDFQWGITRKSALIFRFPPHLGPLGKYTIKTSAKSEWRDPTAWSLYELDDATGEWRLIHNKRVTPPAARSRFYTAIPITGLHQLPPSGDGTAVAKPGGAIAAAAGGNSAALATLGLPSVVPDLSRQKSFEPVTQKTSWQMIQFERQKSSEKQRKGRSIVLDVSSDVHLYFVKAPKTPSVEVYLPRVVPAEVMALEQKPLTLIFEYADLFLTQWNSHKKGVGLYKSIREKKRTTQKSVEKHMENTMCRAFQIKKQHMLSDDACATAASYLQLVMILEAIDVHDAVVTGNPSSRQKAILEKLRKQQEEEALERESEQKEQKEGKTKNSTPEPEVVVLTKAGKPKPNAYAKKAGNDLKGGTGFGGSAGINSQARKAIADKKKELIETDKLTKLILECLVLQLANIKQKALTTPSHREALLSSRLNPFLANYLRSSFMQISERKEVYLSILKCCEAAVLGFGCEILEREEREGARGDRSDIVELIQSIKKQVSVYVNSPSPAGSDKEMVQIATFAAEVDRIVASILHQRSAARRQARKSSVYASALADAKKTNSSSNAGKDDRKVHKKRLESLAVDMIDILSSKVPHVFKKDSEKAQPPPKVIRRLTQEIGSMMTGLPYGVFLRVDNTRMDIMRACIIAPGDAPYENGVFFFDLWIPTNYPQSPPKCKIITTNRGTTRFNPNLYKNGKVCLSLLGTWSGPGWDPTYSNILQVLLSIQSMILGEPQPIVNEPGWVRDRNSKRSYSYNSYLKLCTASYAMKDHLYWIKKQRQDPSHVASSTDPALSPLEGFTEVIATHFWLKKEYILNKQMPKWDSEVKEEMAKNPYGGGRIVKSLDRQKVIEGLKSELKALKEPVIEEEKDEDEDEESDDDDF
eukprot:CAMPEP_0197517684 /NCGR_PEP_ID=MMETSP1318-20131121/2726_1 /TAXON_ID=552666 /ORGANISM="Partenskyella glossopodia, Strain RCC365" /LENGTH=1160 /DNA_ID=CAMNT_0043067459 /DNA_START=76 /DNA_END=3558 /DNA_ORIENTATION=+